MPPATVSDLREADQTLLRIGRLQRDIASEEVLLNDGIDNLKKLTEAKVLPLQEDLQASEQVLLDWIKANPKEFSAPRSRELTYGTIGLRDFAEKPRLVRGIKEEDVAKQLLRAGFKQVVKVKYSIIRNALKNLSWTAERFAKFGIRITQKKNQPFYAINEAKIVATTDEGEAAA